MHCGSRPSLRAGRSGGRTPGKGAFRTAVSENLTGSQLVIGPVSTDFRELDVLQVSTAALRRLGFGSRWAIHPAQVPVINQAFMATPEQLEAARRLVERYDGALDQGVGVCVDEDGHMVDEAVVRAARRILAQARGTAEKSGLR